MAAYMPPEPDRIISRLKQFIPRLKYPRKRAMVQGRIKSLKETLSMSIIAVALMAAFSGASVQDEGPRVETRSEIRIVSAGGEGFGRLDVDGDGVVTREEFSAPMGNAFDRIDVDGDGRLTTEELAAGPGGAGGEGRRVIMMGGPGGHDGPGGSGVQIFTSRIGGSGGPGGSGERDVRIISRDGGPGLPMIFHGAGGPDGETQVFAFRRGGPEGGPGQNQVFVRRFGGPDGLGDMDKDGDGKVSQEEFLTPLREVFQRMDADGDGFLDDGEGRPTPPPAD